MKQFDVIGIVLAAGKSSRMGENKLLLPIEDSTVGSTTLQKAVLSKLDHTFVITTENDSLEWISSTMRNKQNHANWSQVICSDADKGQSYSIRTGVEIAKTFHAKSVMIMLADQPFVQVSLLNNLISCYKKQVLEHKEPNYVASSYQGRVQPPILFSSTLFQFLTELKGDHGARSILRKNMIDGLVIPYADWRCFYDIDTKDDYQWVTQMKMN